MFKEYAEKIAEMAAKKIADKIQPMMENAYRSGYKAGIDAEARAVTEAREKEAEAQARRLRDMYRIGMQRGREEAQAEVAEIDTSLFEELAEMALDAKEEERSNGKA